MARTPLFRMMRRALAAPSQSEGDATGQVTRRELLRLSAAAGALAASGGVFDARAIAASGTSPRIAIVGGGAAGLTAAYRLQAAGAMPAVFEASNRWGGRMFTRSDFYHGMFCELGGEFVDTRHDALKRLAEDLGLSLEPLFTEDDREHDLYFFEGKLRPMKDMLDHTSENGAFVPIARQIASDKARLRDGNGEYTDYARSLDAVSLADYLKKFRGRTEDWAMALIAVAYTGEFGLAVEEQSSLNLVDFISADTKEPFQIFGESDEAYRIKGGSSALINALAGACAPKCRLNLGSALTALAYRGDGIEVTVKSPAGDVKDVYDFVILALPFTRLRGVAGIGSLGLSEEKKTAIEQLGYGNHAKVMCGTSARSWRGAGSDLALASNGNFYSDLPFQNVWETSRSQPGTFGVLTNFLAGKTMPETEAAAVDNLRDGLIKLSPAIGASLDKSAVTSFFWQKHPFTLGSYACPKVGQYTTILPAARQPECGGRLQFAGEHTEPEFLGYMNGAVVSGERAASAVLASLGQKASQSAPK